MLDIDCSLVEGWFSTFYLTFSLVKDSDKDVRKKIVDCVESERDQCPGPSHRLFSFLRSGHICFAGSGLSLELIVQKVNNSYQCSYYSNLGEKIEETRGSINV